MEYKELIPNIKWNCSSYSNVNILVLCHPQQISYYVARVKEHLWNSYSNVTVWQTTKTINSESQLIDEIDTMDAVVCYISEMFYYSDNILADYILPEIIRQNILLLPIVVEKDLISKVNDRYGHIHVAKCIDKKDMGFAHIDQMMESVKLGQNQRKNVIDSFDTRIFDNFTNSFFISYRRADIKYVNLIQRKIHEDFKLLDTQLWFDSYLAPGENYDKNLMNMLEKCDAVILLVTPELLEPGNYVLRIEIPYARKIGKPIIAIKIEKTNLKELRKQYGIDKVYEFEDIDRFSDVLDDAGVVLPEVNLYSRHLVDIGKRYRDGMYVEQNIDIACELFYQAVDEGSASAYEELIHIKTGDFNEAYKDYDEAVRLFKEFIELLKNAYEVNKSDKWLFKLLDYQRKLGEFYTSQNKLPEAYGAFKEFYNHVKNAGQNESNRLRSYMSVACLLLGKTLNEMGKGDEAESYYRKSVKIDSDLYDDDYANSTLYNNYLTSLCELGDFYQKRGKLLKALIQYTEVLEVIEKSGTFYAHEWENNRVHNGYMNESSAQKTNNAKQFAVVSILEIEQEFRRIGRFHPKIKYYPRSYITDKRILKNSGDTKIPLLSHEIMLNSIGKMKWFINFIRKQDYDFDLRQNRYCVDAKSVIGVVALDAMDTIELVIHTDNLKKAEKLMKKIVKELNK